MKVRINYQINLRDVPNTIADLIDKICNSINWNTSFGSNTQSLSSLARRLRDGENISQIIDDISQYREQLSEIDSSLEDYCYILAQAQKTESEIFLAKKEIKESRHWLRLLAKSNPERVKEIREFWKEAQELLLIFSKISRSSKV